MPLTANLGSGKYSPLDELPSPSRLKELNVIGYPLFHYGWEIDTKQLVHYLINIKEWPCTDQMPVVDLQSTDDNAAFELQWSTTAIVRFQAVVRKKYKINIAYEDAVCTRFYSNMFALWSNDDYMERTKSRMENRRLDNGELVLEALKEELRKAFARAGEADFRPKWYWSNLTNFE